MTSPIRHLFRVAVIGVFLPGVLAVFLFWPGKQIVAGEWRVADATADSVNGKTENSASPDCGDVSVRLGTGAAACIEPGSGTAFKDCADCPAMVVVPAGTFTMGSPPDEAERQFNEDPLEVTIEKPFAVARYAVMRGEFAAFTRAVSYRTLEGCWTRPDGKLQEEADRIWRIPGFAQTKRHPVVCISWYDAKSFVEWLSNKTGKAYRLLTDAEREYVARAGTSTPFWWGKRISPNQANYDASLVYGEGIKGELRGATVPVGSFAANPWGLYDVHGNVWEWTEDCWSFRNEGNPANGEVRTDGDCWYRVIRGGGWDVKPAELRSALRGGDLPGNRSNNIGFRVARTLEP